MRAGSKRPSKITMPESWEPFVPGVIATMMVSMSSRGVRPVSSQEPRGVVVARDVVEVAEDPGAERRLAELAPLHDRHGRGVGRHESERILGAADGAGVGRGEQDEARREEQAQGRSEAESGSGAVHGQKSFLEKSHDARPREATPKSAVEP